MFTVLNSVGNKPGVKRNLLTFLKYMFSIAYDLFFRDFHTIHWGIKRANETFSKTKYSYDGNLNLKTVNRSEFAVDYLV